MEVRKYLITALIIFVIKVLFGILLSSNTMLASSILEVMYVVFNLVGNTKKENKKYKGIISSLISIIFIIISIGVVYYSFIGGLNKPSWLLILICIVLLFVRYMVVCIGIIKTYNSKKGLLIYGNMTSNMDFIILGIILGSLVICKLSGLLSILKYGDIVGTIIVSLITIYYGLRVIVNSIKYMEDKEYHIALLEDEITKQKEVKKINSIKYLGFGGIRRTEVNIELNNGINMTDLSGFALSLQDYVLKSGEIAQVNLIDSSKVFNKVNKPHVRSKKEDARNSRSRNSKTNSKKKNTKKTNKKR
ncbi:MAG: hypothetical protein ACI4OP_02650 [Candidatus Coprovivens sp.]